MDGAYKIVNACSYFAGLLPVETENRFTCVTQCHLLLISRKSWFLCCCRPTLLFGLNLLHPAGRRWKGKLTGHCLFFLREGQFCWSSLKTGSIHFITVRTVELNCCKCTSYWLYTVECFLLFLQRLHRFLLHLQSGCYQLLHFGLKQLSAP